MMLRGNNFYSYRDPCEALTSCQRDVVLEEVRNYMTGQDFYNSCKEPPASSSKEDQVDSIYWFHLFH